jgi:hypothetical protein
MNLQSCNVSYIATSLQRNEQRAPHTYPTEMYIAHIYNPCVFMFVHNGSWTCLNIPRSTILDAPIQLKYAHSTALQCRKRMCMRSYLFSEINYKSFYIYIINSTSIFIQMQNSLYRTQVNGHPQHSYRDHEILICCFQFQLNTHNLYARLYYSILRVKAEPLWRWHLTYNIHCALIM